MSRRLLATLATALVGLSGFVGGAIDRATRGHPHVRHAVYAIENEASRLLAHGFAATGRCGVERWDEKTLSASDPASAPLLSTASRPSNVPALRALGVPGGKAPDGQRVPGSAEATVWKLAGAYLVAYKLELDSDIHLEIRSAIDGSTMIAEIPDPGCVSNPVAKARVAAAREAFVSEVGTPQGYYTKTKVRVTLAGPGFFDFVHGQLGVAPNGVEVHPVLSFVRWRSGASMSAYSTMLGIYGAPFDSGSTPPESR